ncbi:S-layer homology domain-containing protein, partial [Paenibacillus pini]
MKALQKFFAQKWFIYVVCTAIIFSSYSFAGLAMAQTSDIKGHWAEKQLEEWQNKGLLHGFSDGSLRPNSSITRAELAALMNRYFKFTVQKEIQFTDLVKNQWQYPELAKAAQAGYIEGYSDGTIRPDKQVSRQEVAVMLANVIKASAAAESDKSSFRDEADIAAWSKNAVRTLVAKGLISGYKDGTFRPQASLTRAEAVILLSRVPNAQSTVYDKAGTYGPATGMDMVMGDVIINVAGVTLQNTMVHGNLVLGKDIASGDVTLKNVKVEGTTTVSGGGEKSIHLLDTTLGKLVVNRENGVVRIVAELASSIQDTTVLSAAILEESSNLTGAGFINVLLSKGLNSTLSGTFKDLKIEATNMKIEILKGSVESVTVDGSGNTITLSKDASIVKLVVNALIKLLGSGKVSTATINEGGKGSSFEVAPTKVDGPQSGSIKGNSTGGSGGGSNTGGGSSGGGGSTGGGTGGNPDTSIPAAPSVIGVSEGQTYTSGVLPNWTDAVGTTSTATLNGAAYIKGNGITEAGEYTLVVTALKTSTGKTSKTTVKFKVDPAVKLIGYVNGETKWSEAKAIDATKLTHIDYAFTHILDNKLVPVEGNFYKDNYAYMKNLKKQNPNLKILNSVGGWAANGFSDAAFTPETREVFVKSIIDYIVKYDLDG